MRGIMATTAGERLRNVLTWSEREALRALLDHLGDRDEAEIVASAVVDKLRATCSIVVQALRIAEAAGVLTARSVGRRGTHVCILDRAALEEAVR